MSRALRYLRCLCHAFTCSLNKPGIWWALAAPAHDLPPARHRLDVAVLYGIYAFSVHVHFTPAHACGSRHVYRARATRRWFIVRFFVGLPACTVWFYRVPFHFWVSATRLQVWLRFVRSLPHLPHGSLPLVLRRIVLALVDGFCVLTTVLPVPFRALQHPLDLQTSTPLSVHSGVRSSLDGIRVPALDV